VPTSSARTVVDVQNHSWELLGAGQDGPDPAVADRSSNAFTFGRAGGGVMCDPAGNNRTMGNNVNDNALRL